MPGKPKAARGKTTRKEKLKRTQKPFRKLAGVIPGAGSTLKKAAEQLRKSTKKFADGGTGKMSPNFTGRTSGASTLALRRRGLDKGRRDMLNTFKEAKRMNKSGRMTLDDVKAVMKKNKSKLGKASTKAMKARGLKRGGKAKK